MGVEDETNQISQYLCERADKSKGCDIGQVLRDPAPRLDSMAG